MESRARWSVTGLLPRARSVVGGLALFVTGCSMANQTIDIARLGSVQHVQVYEGGKPVIERSVEVGSSEDRAVAEWLRTHADGWQVSLISYAPMRRIQGENFNLNFHKDLCVLNYRTQGDGAWTQVVRDLGDDEAIPDVFAVESK